MAKKLEVLDPLTAIRGLYFRTTRATIERDFARALDLLKQLPDEDARSRATVYMHGLAQMRAEWGGGASKKRPQGSQPPRKRR